MAKNVNLKVMNLSQRIKHSLPRGELERMKEYAVGAFDIHRRSVDRRFSKENFRKHELKILAEILGCMVADIENPYFEFDANRVKYPDPTTGK